jgi:hypothetical protein
MTNESENVYIKRKENGMYGLFSRITFRKGENILDIRLSDKQDNRDFRSIELAEGHYMHPDGQFTNHSCDPNAYIDKQRGFLIASKQVWPNDEITFDYLASETEIVSPFNCHCGAENCVGKIGTDK